MCTQHPLAAAGAEVAENLPIPHQVPSALRFWEVDHFFKCPIIGMCLTLGEQKQLLRKAGMPWKNKSPFDMHEMLVASAESENRLSRKVEHLLSRKFGDTAAGLHPLSERDFMEHWRSAFESGRFASHLWAAASKVNLSAQAQREIFGTVHMAMHSAAEGQASMKRRTADLLEKMAGQTERFEALKRAHRDAQKEIEGLRAEQATLKAKLLTAISVSDALKARIDSRPQTVDLGSENRQLKADMADKVKRIQTLEQQLTLQRNRHESMADDLAGQKRTNERLRSEMQGILGAFKETSCLQADCPASNLCQKRVLIVGGIARMESLYRQFIEEEGGTLEYHTGSVKNGSRQLESSLKRADIVLCPVNCNSHAACSLVKRLGRKHKKPVQMLTNFSLNAVSQAIRTCNGGQPAAN
jgi:uncharacterized coiled-coil protein SlyX